MMENIYCMYRYNVNMYLLCKYSSILNNSTTQTLHMHRPSLIYALFVASASFATTAVIEMVQQGCSGFVKTLTLYT